MIPVTSFAGKRVAVFGLGASGISAARALIAGGAEVATWDDTANTVAAAEAAGLPTVDLKAADWSGFAALILSPGVPLTHPKPHWSVEKARAAGIEVIGDVELFSRERARLAPTAPFVAVTGTNGKSTTVALIAHLLRSAGREAQLGGNIGTAILSLEPPAASRIHVVECSSFQIDLAPSLAPSVGVLLNLSPDHIERHGTFEHYVEVKTRLVEKADIAIIGVDDRVSAGIADRLARAGKTVRRISAKGRVANGIYVDDGALYEAKGSSLHWIASLDRINSLRGAHNAENAAAAVAVVTALGVKSDRIAAGLKTFAGLPHRMEEVGRRGRVLFINDSKATNADATARALACFDRIYWILGGRPKEGGIAGLDEYLPRVAKAYLIGEAAVGFAKTIAGRVPTVMSGTLAAATEAAAADAAKDKDAEPVVLLSPAAASYDQFKNFEHRGDTFRALVQALSGVTKTEAA